MKFICSTLIYLSIVSSCNQESNKDKINNTVIKTLNLIESQSYKQLEEIIENKSDKDLELVIFKAVEAKYFIDKYHFGKIENIPISSDENLDSLGRMKVVVHLFDGFDSSTGFSQVKLILKFGPPQIIPFSKLSGFDINRDVDALLRRKLINEGKIYNIDSITSYEYHKLR